MVHNKTDAKASGARINSEYNMWEDVVKKKQHLPELISILNGCLIV